MSTADITWLTADSMMILNSLGGSVVVSSSLVLNDTELVVPLSNPRILWDDVWRGGTITASSEDANASAANVADGLTWDHWRPTSLPATIEVQVDLTRSVDYALFAAHDIGTNEISVKVQYHDGSTWVDAMPEYMPGNDGVIVLLFDSVTATRFRVYLDGDNSPQQMPSIGIIMMGSALAVPRGLMLNHRPVTLSRRTVIRPQLSETGLLLGRSIRRSGVTTKLAFQYLETPWVREKFNPFIEYARRYPFGWVWNARDYRTEVAFLWLPSGSPDIRPELAGMNDRMNVSFDVEGVV